MTSFEDREKAFEGKFKLDQEMAFKVSVRRNKLLGLWVAKQLGLDAAAAEEYAKAVATADMERPGDSDVVEKVQKDLSAKGITMTEHRIRAELESLTHEARKQIAGK